MKYMGSKNRIAKHILPIILKDRKEGQWYIEPFVGGANIIDKVDGNRIGSDINEFLIATCKALRDGWLPHKSIPEKIFNDVKNNPENYCKQFIGYVGFQLSYGAMWFGSYRRDNQGIRDYSLEAYNNVKKQAPKLKGINFSCGDYFNLDIPEQSIIYCDPPYEGTAKYKANKEEFNHNAFWAWCREMVMQNHKVFISEYNAPDDFVSVWQKEITSSLGKDTGSKKGVEKLFVHESQFEASNEA
ncbi:MAG TPA: DNA adenine methylase [Flavobacteriales bacterium]|nr:DNA adenine methylase [Flavobacteriales bacterium]